MRLSITYALFVACTSGCVIHAYAPAPAVTIASCGAVAQAPTIPPTIEIAAPDRATPELAPPVVGGEPTFTAGEPIRIQYTSPISVPSGQQHWITLVPAGAADSAWGSWHYVASGAMSDVLTTSAAGEYEIRLHDLYPAFDYKVIARVRVHVVAAGATSVSASSLPACPSTFQGVGDAVTCVCPSGAGGSVWGSRIYTTDSALCAAARHAGVVGPSGGVVTARSAPGCGRYSGTVAHDIRTSAWGAYSSSFYFPGAGYATCEP
ncbi:MAG: LCCL domain-containing protein [Polyangiales bacterium]